MSADELLKRLEAYGGDINGIRDRFSGDVRLYQMCFDEFMTEPNFDILEKAVKAEGFEGAFQAAHALKGVSGNLGLTPFYDKICVLVEALRAKQYERVKDLYDDVKLAFNALKSIVSSDLKTEEKNSDNEISDTETPNIDEEISVKTDEKINVKTDEKINVKTDEKNAEKPQDAKALSEGVLADGKDEKVFPHKKPQKAKAFFKRIFKREKPEKSAEEKRADELRKKRLFLPVTIVTALLIILLIIYIFCRIVLIYQKNTVDDIETHLVEINEELKLYIESKIETETKSAESVAHSLSHGVFSGDEEILRFMASRREVWGAGGTALFTEDGRGFRSDGSEETKEISERIINGVKRDDRYQTVQNSMVIFAVTVDTDIKFDGSKIIAVAIAEDVTGFLDNMGISTFDGAGYMMLTDKNGNVISRLNHPESSAVANVASLFEGLYVLPLSDEYEGIDIFETQKVIVYRVSDSNEKRILSYQRKDDATAIYVASTPVYADGETFRLFYFVPVRATNSAMADFTKNVTILSVVTLVVLGAAFGAIFGYVLWLRQKRYDKAILTRERTFDLLAENTLTAFGLLSVDSEEPIFLSKNAKDVTGFDTVNIVKTENGYRLRGKSGPESGTIKKLNAKMEKWDGKSAFRSGYLKNLKSEIPKYYEIQLSPIDDRYREFVGIAQDVTLAYEREAAAKEALNMADQANKSKTTFLSNMSHDIRTPMNAIVNMADFAIESINDPSRLREYLKTIRESSDHLLMLINDILDMSRIESGKAIMETAAFDLIEELQRIKDIAAPLCSAKELIFLTDFKKIKTRCVVGDKVKVSQIMMNLLSNAVKFTPAKGAVRFSVEEIPSIRENFASMRFAIEDNGIGVKKENLTKIFDPFVREDEKRVSYIQGTGLGLSICHSYVTAMGGTIKCESEEGEGSVFTVELSFEKAESAETAVSNNNETTAYEITPFIGRRCLLCEDNFTNQVIARTILERLGFIVDIASNGRDGVIKFVNSVPDRYDIIYMDIQMPLMDGYEAAVAIRESRHSQAKTVPIIAMTANVFAEDIEKARIAGMNGHIGKPINTLTLANETKKILYKTENF